MTLNRWGQKDITPTTTQVIILEKEQLGSTEEAEDRRSVLAQPRKRLRKSQLGYFNVLLILINSHYFYTFASSSMSRSLDPREDSGSLNCICNIKS
jgi:hypothetical protein